jgi:hypothetical protein
VDSVAVRDREREGVGLNYTLKLPLKSGH